MTRYVSIVNGPCLGFLLLFLLLIYLVILFTFDGPCDADNTLCLDLVFRLSLPIRNRDLGSDEQTGMDIEIDHLILV